MIKIKHYLPSFSHFPRPSSSPSSQRKIREKEIQFPSKHSSPISWSPHSNFWAPLHLLLESFYPCLMCFNLAPTKLGGAAEQENRRESCASWNRPISWRSVWFYLLSALSINWDRMQKGVSSSKSTALLYRWWKKQRCNCVQGRLHSAWNLVKRKSHPGFTSPYSKQCVGGDAQSEVLSHQWKNWKEKKAERYFDDNWHTNFQFQHKFSSAFCFSVKLGYSPKYVKTKLVLK